MFERILVAIDGGKTSKSLLETSCAIADRYQSKLGILYVTEPEEISDDLLHAAQVEGVLRTTNYAGAIDRYSSDAMSNLNEEMRRAKGVHQLTADIAKDIVSEAEAFSKGQNVKVVKTFVRSGDVAKAILEVASDAKADLIVMGHTRQSTLHDLIHTRIVEAVDRKANCPCLVLSQ